MDHQLKSSIKFDAGIKVDENIKSEAENYRKMLQNKKKNGEIPMDIDIEDEVKRFIEDKIQNNDESSTTVNNNNQLNTSTKGWKQKVSDVSEEG